MRVKYEIKLLKTSFYQKKLLKAMKFMFQID